MATFQTGAGELYYEDHGEGQPVVFIHGLWLTSRFFAKQRDAMSGRYRFIAPDLRSHGRSETVLHGNTVPLQTQDLHELFEALDLHDIVLVGWSSGAFCIWQYLLDYGSNDVAGIVIVDESPTDFNWPDWSLGAQDIHGLVGMLDTVQTNHATMVRSGFVPRLFASTLEAEDLDWMVAEVTMIPPTVAAAVAFDEITRDYRAMLGDIEVPTLICFGRHDLFLSPDNGPYLAGAIPQARLVMFEHSGHAPFWDEPERFNDELEGFIRSLGAMS
jgi:pimeloyl-ACP methyl ester carboxylesterase